MSEYRNIIILGKNDYVLGVNYSDHINGTYKCRRLTNTSKNMREEMNQLAAVNVYRECILANEDDNLSTIVVSSKVREIIRNILLGKIKDLNNEEKVVAENFKSNYRQLVSKISIVSVSESKSARPYSNKKAYEHLQDIIFKVNNKINKVTSQEKKKRNIE